MYFFYFINFYNKQLKQKNKEKKKTIIYHLSFKKSNKINIYIFF